MCCRGKAGCTCPERKKDPQERSPEQGPECHGVPRTYPCEQAEVSQERR